MKRHPIASEPAPSAAEREHHPASPSRRKFMGKIGGVAAAAATASAIGLSPLLESSATKAEAATGPSSTHSRVLKSYALRIEAATRDARIPVPPHTTNSDEKHYPDKSGTYTKCLLQDG
ncbi:MAG: twin-arginine translocation signal domain-containing protein [Terriglobales bacterium]